MIVGWKEWIKLPNLNINALIAKIDTGARTSSIHAEDISAYDDIVEFITSPIPTMPEYKVKCSANIIDKRRIRNSDGQSEVRFVIESELVLGPLTRRIQLTLNDRSKMSVRMLIGRQAFADDILINPLESYLQEKLSYSIYTD